jgi:S-DNA-T family DNA segregation ATPase FtsK/SpoIIIE
VVEFSQQHAITDDSDIADINEDEAFDENDELYEQAVKLVIKHQTASTSFLQRKLNIDYEHALRLLEDMESDGIVGPNMGKQSRDILIDDD